MVPLAAATQRKLRSPLGKVWAGVGRLCRSPVECPRFAPKPYGFYRQLWIRLLGVARDQHVNDHFDPDEAS